MTDKTQKVDLKPEKLKNNCEKVFPFSECINRESFQISI